MGPQGNFQPFQGRPHTLAAEPAAVPQAAMPKPQADPAPAVPAAAPAKPALTRIISGGSGQVGGGDGTPQSRADMERARRARYAKLQSATDAKAKDEQRRRKKADAQERVSMRSGMQMGNFDTYGGRK